MSASESERFIVGESSRLEAVGVIFAGLTFGYVLGKTLEKFL